MGQVDGMPKPVTISPQDLQAQMTLRINDASMEPESKEQRAQNFMTYYAALKDMIASSMQQAQGSRWATKPLYVDYASLVQDMSQKFGQSNYDKILLDGDSVMQAMQNSQTPFIMPNERMIITPADLKPSELSQLLQRNGIQPDPSRESDPPETPAQLAGDQESTSNMSGDTVNPHAISAQEHAQQTAQNAQVTPDHLLQAQQQEHQQAIDQGKQQIEAAKVALQAHKQMADQQLNFAQLNAKAAEPVDKKKKANV
jgi:hypothetical protein